MSDAKLEAIATALTGIAETLATHTEILERIEEMATEEPPKSELPATLKALEERLARHERAFDRIEAALLALPAQLARAIHGELP